MLIRLDTLLVGMTGSVVAALMPQPVPVLRRACANGVHVVMTRGACRFVTPTAMRLYSGNRAHTDLLRPAPAGIPHIALPATADVMPPIEMVLPELFSAIRAHAGSRQDASPVRQVPWFMCHVVADETWIAASPRAGRGHKRRLPRQDSRSDDRLRLLLDPEEARCWPLTREQTLPMRRPTMIPARVPASRGGPGVKPGATVRNKTRPTRGRVGYAWPTRGQVSHMSG